MHQAQEALAVIPGALPLHAVVHGCTCNVHPAWGLLFCDPFAEEKKCAQRVMVEAARAFCEADLGSVRFDYRGTGDSPGEFLEATPDLWVQDILAAIDYMRHELRVPTLGLLGLRLGGALALQAALSGGDVDFLEAVPDPELAALDDQGDADRRGDVRRRQRAAGSGAGCVRLRWLPHLGRDAAADRGD